MMFKITFEILSKNKHKQLIDLKLHLNQKEISF